jgi:heptosyltransferase-1
VRVLITRLSAMGDVVHTWPLVAALRRAVPGAEIAWLVEEPLLPLVAGHPDVTAAIPVATREWRRAPLAASTRHGILAVRARIAAFAPEHAIDPQGLIKSAGWACLAGVPDRIGFSERVRRERLAGLFYTTVVASPAHLRHVVDLNLSLLTALGLVPEYGDLPDAGFLRAPADRGGSSDDDATALLPGAGRAGKRWDWASFAELARRLAANGARPVVVWGPGEEALAGRIAAAAGAGTAVAPPTSLPELARLLGRSRAVVGGDTGPVHLAAALGTPTVAIHLGTDPERNGPRGRRVHIVSGARAGSGARSARTGRLREVAVDEVQAAVEKLLAEGR